MPNEPPVFAKQMNRWCIAMTHSRRRRDAKRARKGVLRQMKRLLRPIGEHACRHRDHLAADYARTRFSERQATRIIARIDARLEQLPAAIKQAHERSIGARPVPNAEKILRVYEPDVQTVVRGKASGEVEFGNTLMISENVTGLITDWQWYQGMTQAEWRQFDQSLERQNQFDLSTPIKAASTDRGFSTKRLCERLAEADIYDATCPRDPPRSAATATAHAGAAVRGARTSPGFDGSLHRHHQATPRQAIECQKLHESLPGGSLEHLRSQPVAHRPTAGRPTPAGPSRLKPPSLLQR
ncbi:MAG: hypothetical protein J6386_02660 [Candidatus Synoicihabitans palmerolidicus]|nr:hypothetical protein [Candidatus Synoicihabitans palmerolidicus]